LSNSGADTSHLAVALEKAGARIIGTTPDNIDRAEDRKRFQTLLKKLGLVQPQNGTANSIEDAMRVAKAIGYPWWCAFLRPRRAGYGDHIR